MYHTKKTRAKKHRKYELGREAAETKIDENKRVKEIKTKGGGSKRKLLADNKANVLIGGKNTACQVISVVNNPASKDFTRRNVITKGAILKVKTPEDKEIQVRVTSRPGQIGSISAVEIA